MKRALTIVGLGVSIVALSAGPAAAHPRQPYENDQRYPASKGYYWVDETLTLKAGEACNVEVIMIIKGHQRDIVNGEVVTGDSPEPKLGDRHIGQAPDEIVKIVNPANKRKITKVGNGSFYDKVVDFDHDGKLDLKSKGVGKNWYFGAGVKGIVWANGKQHFTVDDFLGASELHINKTKGKTVELCKKVGAKAVPGKNPVVEEPGA